MKDLRMMVLCMMVMVSVPFVEARLQGDVLYPGSTVQGDVLRGEGVAYEGAAVFYVYAATARSIDADTRMRFYEYDYRSYQECLRKRARRIASKAAGRNARLAEIQRRLRESPTEPDLASGDAPNVMLADLSDPVISPSLRDKAKVALPGGEAATPGRSRCAPGPWSSIARTTSAPSRP